MNLLSGNPLVLEAAVFAILTGGLLFGVIVATVATIPLTLLLVAFLYPYRCQRCLRRSCCFGSSKVHRHSGHKTEAAGNAERERHWYSSASMRPIRPIASCPRS